MPRVVLLCLCAAISLPAADWYVSPTGSSGNSGAIGSPWSLAHALNHPAAVQPGDTIWLRGGTYSGTFRSDLTGTAIAPIKVRAYQQEIPRIDGGDSGGQIILQIAGAHTWYWGLEVMSSHPNRISAQITSGPSDIARGECVTTDETVGTLPGLKFINMVIHDCRQGLSPWDEATGTEAYGNIIFNNGWEAPDRTHGHGIYTQNQTGTKLFRDNLLFNQFSHGFHGFGSDTAFLIGFDLQGNASFNNFERDMLLGGGSPVQNSGLTNNYTYGGVTKIGAGEDVQDTTVTSNYFAGVAAMELNAGQSTTELTMTGNTFVGRRDNFVNGDYPSNTYFEWLTPPTTNTVVVRPNSYESGRAHIIIYNWQDLATVNLDVSSVLTVGSQYELRDAMNFPGTPILSGTYSGGTLAVPMNQTTVAQPIGNSTMTFSHTAPRFAALVLITTALAAQSVDFPIRLVNVGNQVFRGYKLYMQLQGIWTTAYPCTVNTSTDTLTCPDRTFNVGDPVRVVTSGNYPTADGSTEPSISQWVLYKVASVSGNTIRITSTAIGGTPECGAGDEDPCKTFSNTGTGTLYVATTPGAISTGYRLKNLTLPTGFTVATFRNSADAIVTDSGSGYFYADLASVEIDVAADAPLGSGPCPNDAAGNPTASECVNIEFDIGGTSMTDLHFVRPVRVEQLIPVVINRPTSFPALPEPATTSILSKFSTRAGTACTKSTGACAPSVGDQTGNAGFYDMGWGYDQRARFEQDDQWLNCARCFTDGSQVPYIRGNPLGVSGFNLFTDGVKARLGRTRDGRYKQLIYQVSSPMNFPSGSTRDDQMREAAYALETHINAAKVVLGCAHPDQLPAEGVGQLPKIKRRLSVTAGRLLGMMEQTRSDNYIYQQTYWLGLALRALIRYWEYTADPRVPVEVKRTLDYAWNTLWVPNTGSGNGRLVYIQAPLGGRCEYDCRGGPDQYDITLALMTLPAFAWYFSITGDDTYRQRGDTILAEVDDQSSAAITTKMLAENFRWGYAYFLWRTGQQQYEP